MPRKNRSDEPTSLAHLQKLWQKRWARLSIYAVTAITTVLLLIGFLNTFIFLPVKNPNYGVSFSVKQAKDLGINWQANFTALLDDLQFKNLRLMSYWDDIEPTRGTFDFTDLDWQFEQAHQRGAKISLAIGLRQPRWPECHAPQWSLTLHGNEWKQALYAYIQVVVERYKNHPALASYQLENEAMNNWFGTCDAPDRQRLIEEFALVKQWDPHHKVIMSLSDQHGLPLGQPVPDEYGFSVYRTVWNDKTYPNGYITYPTPLWYHRARAAAINVIQNRPIMVHELQLEPWGPIDFKYLDVDEQDKSMSVTQIEKNIRFARQIGLKDIYLWGGEWWYWRQAQGDPTIWRTVKSQINRDY